MPEPKADSAARAGSTEPDTPAPRQPAPVPAAAAPAPAAQAQPISVQAASANFDINAIPVSQKPMPPFPYLDWPSELAVAARQSKVEEFDRRYVVAGQQALPVEGHIDGAVFQTPMQN